MSDSILNPRQDAAYAKTAVRFSETLVRGDFEDAHGLLSPGLRSELPAAELRRRYEEMIEYGDGPANSAQLVSTLDDWPSRQPNDAGWAYVSIEGPEFMEGITVIVEEAGDALAIRDIEWGRP